MKPTRRKQTRKPDRFTNPDATRAETLTHFALGPYDAACRAMDIKWGIDRLPQIVTPQMAATWGQTMANMNEAIAGSYSAANADQARANVIACVESALRGFAAMDAAAEAAGAPKSNPQVWEFEVDGQMLAIIKDDAHWPALKAQRPDLIFYTIREVAAALRATDLTGEIVKEAKRHFPNAHVSKITNTANPVNWDLGGDRIPF